MASWFEEFLARGNSDAVQRALQGSDPATALTRLQPPQQLAQLSAGSQRNAVKDRKAEYDRVYSQAQSTVDPAERAALLAQADDLEAGASQDLETLGALETGAPAVGFPGAPTDASIAQARANYERLYAAAQAAQDPAEREALLGQADLASQGMAVDLNQQDFTVDFPDRAAGATAPAAQVGMQIPTFQEFQRATRTGGGGNAREFRAQGAEAQAAARNERASGLEAEEAIRQRGAAAEAAGVRQADTLQQATLRYTGLLEQQQAEREEREQLRVQASRTQASAQADLEREEAKQQKSVWASMSGGQRAAAAIFIGLGQLGAGLTRSGRNDALEIVKAQIEHR